MSAPLTPAERDAKVRADTIAEVLRLLSAEADKAEARLVVGAPGWSPVAPGLGRAIQVVERAKRFVSAFPLSVSGASMILSERVRQVGEEGYTLAHDLDEHGTNEALAVAAWCYLGDYVDDSGDTSHEVPAEWPWDWDRDPGVGCTWKPTPEDPIRQLVKAGALIAAEIDILLAQRARS